jgi:hypothetical protein
MTAATTLTTNNRLAMHRQAFRHPASRQATATTSVALVRRAAVVVVAVVTTVAVMVAAMAAHVAAMAAVQAHTADKK